MTRVARGARRDSGTLWVLTPTDKPVGGVIKIFDYVQHARALGWQVVVSSPLDSPPESWPVLAVPGLSSLAADSGIRWQQGLRVAPRVGDVVFFSWPVHYLGIEPRLPPGFPPERVIHIVQNTRHANPRWLSGYALRLLTRPMRRIITSEAVFEAVAPHINPNSRATVIELGHRTEYFAKQRVGGLPPAVKVGYTTWKSDLGDRVTQQLGGPDWTHRAIRDTADWPRLRELYHWADVFLATPGPQEGHYLPGLEAMAAGAILVTPDVGGNRAYCRFGVNCVEVAYDDVDSYRDALCELAAAPAERVEALRAEGYAELPRHSLEVERQRFAALLDELPG